jgi:excisionase family DNA binding protein
MKRLPPVPPSGSPSNDSLSVPQFLTVGDVARLLCLHEKTVYLWVSRGSIPHVRLGRRVVFSPADIGRWLGARREGA